ncbi:MAG: MBL fold metallo-hydrolase [Verrucomicrobiota bacterium]
MQFTDLNAEGGIGANSVLVELGDYRFVVDAGLSPKQEGAKALPRFDLVEPGSLDFILLTHCHLDHVGALPVLCKQQPQAQILCSAASGLLAPRMLRNSIQVMHRQREELNLPELPLYQYEDIERVEERLRPLPLEKTFNFRPEGREKPLQITPYAAGHIAGAIGVQVVYKGRKILFSGDVLFSDQRTLPGSSLPFAPVDTLVMETTRGQHERDPERNRESEVERLFAKMREVLARGGSILVPVFALGRMQEILTLLADARENNTLPKTPIYCSGLGMDIVNYFDVIAKRMGQVNFKRSILSDLKVRQPDWKVAPGRDVSQKGIYILSSGMLVENTPSYKTAAAMIENPDNAILFVGYCDPDTPGGKLLTTQSGDEFTFEALDYRATIRAEIQQYDMSGHADREELLEFALACDPRVIVLTHGDPPSRDWFSQALAAAPAKLRVIDPQPLVATEV